jgi:tRNA(fMet)-specific endonuclease VapC
MALNYLLDTDICIYIAKQKPTGVLNKFKTMAIGDVAMSIITYGELYLRAKKSHHSKKALDILEDLTSLIPVLPIPVQAGTFYGKIRSSLEKQGKRIGDNNLWIASHALALDVIIVTNNMKEFSRIDQLELENWVDED